MAGPGCPKAHLGQLPTPHLPPLHPAAGVPSPAGARELRLRLGPRGAEPSSFVTAPRRLRFGAGFPGSGERCPTSLPSLQ